MQGQSSHNRYQLRTVQEHKAALPGGLAVTELLEALATGLEGSVRTEGQGNLSVGARLKAGLPTLQRGCTFLCKVVFFSPFPIIGFRLGPIFPFFTLPHTPGMMLVPKARMR